MILKTIIVFILIWITKKIYDLIDAVLEIECIFRSVGSRVSSILSLLEKEKEEESSQSSKRRKEIAGRVAYIMDSIMNSIKKEEKVEKEKK